MAGPINKFLYKMGYINYREFGLNFLPERYRDEGRMKLQELSDVKVIGNPEAFYRKHLDFGHFLHHIHQQHGLEGVPRDAYEKSFVIRGAADLFGYRPSGTRIWNYFSNPFGVFSYIGENVDAVKICNDLVSKRVEADGIVLKGAKKTSNERLLQVYKILKQYNLIEIRNQIITHLQLYGNAYILPRKNFLGGITEFEVLFPNKLLPVFNRITEEIIEYEYIVGRIRIIYQKDELLHLKNQSVSGKWVGTPPLVSAVTNIEALLSAQNVNNTFFQKGGLLQAIVGLADPKDDTFVGSGPNSEWVREVQAIYDSQHAGAKGNGGVMFMNKVDGVYPLKGFTGMESDFLEGMDHTSKYIAYLLGIPSEKMGINRSSALQYQAAMIEDVLNTQFNDTIMALTTKVDEFINVKFMQELLDIDDVIMTPGGGYGATTIGASEAILNLSNSGYKITHNEANKFYLRLPPLPNGDPRANMVIQPAVKGGGKDGAPPPAPMIITPGIDPELEAIKGLNFRSVECKKICLGGRYDGFLPPDGW